MKTHTQSYFANVLYVTFGDHCFGIVLMILNLCYVLVDLIYCSGHFISVFTVYMPTSGFWNKQSHKFSPVLFLLVLRLLTRV